MLTLLIEYTLQALVAFAGFAATAAVITSVGIRGGSSASNYFWLAVLSFIAATAPYIGLFGTVWHIIAALSGIGDGNLNVAAIAKPIGDALVATLWGLGAAILALVGSRLSLLIAATKRD